LSLSFVRFPREWKSRGAVRGAGSGNARQYGIRIVGPNCLGVMLPHQGINTRSIRYPKIREIAFISQSGAIISTIVDWSLPEEIGFSAVISIGNQADLSFEDFLLYAGDDPLPGQLSSISKKYSRENDLWRLHGRLP